MDLQKKSRPVILIGLFAVITGLVVMLGWLLNIPVLQQIIPGATAIRFNAGLGFALSGAALLTASVGSNKANKIVFILFSALVAIVGVGTVAQDLFHFNSGIDQLIAADRTPASYSFPYPGRSLNALLPRY
jgi:hypothetical protein